MLDFVLVERAFEDVMSFGLCSLRWSDVVRCKRLSIQFLIIRFDSFHLVSWLQKKRIGRCDQTIVCIIILNVYVIVQTFQADQQQTESNQTQTNNQQFDQILRSFDVRYSQFTHFRERQDSCNLQIPIFTKYCCIFDDLNLISTGRLLLCFFFNKKENQFSTNFSFTFANFFSKLFDFRTLAIKVNLTEFIQKKIIEMI